MATVFINEFHYDNDGTDTGERIEIAGPAGTDLTGWSLVLYNGNGGAPYTTTPLSGSIPNQQDGFGTIAVPPYPSNGIQNGDPDGIALVDNNGNVVQFLSYEGSFTAVGGPANGMTSTNISPPAETSITPVGFSLQLTGTGRESQDFTWSGPADDNFTFVNDGQTFTGNGGGKPTFSISNEIVIEGGVASFTVTRSGELNQASSVTFQTSDGSATAPSDYVPQNGTIDFVTGQATQTIEVGTVENAQDEPDETFFVNLSDPINATISDPQGVGTINDNDTPVTITPIYDIQGAAQTSPLVGNSVTTTGVVTAVDSNGFYLQDPTGDGNNNTSDGIFVFTNSDPGVNSGDQVRVAGTVSEFTPGGVSTGNLSTTQISTNLMGITTLANNVPLPSSVILGVDRTPPTEVIDNDQDTQYNTLTQGNYQPDEDGIDFYESLEGMRVTVNNALAVSPTSGFGEIFAVVNNGMGATGLSNRGTINISPDDFNPERIQIDADSTVSPQDIPQVDVGAQLGDVTGVVSYNFGNFEVLPTESFSPTASTLQRETSNLAPGENQLTVASYNVLNLDPVVEDLQKVDGKNADNVDDDLGDGRFAAIAQQIVNNLNSPDIIGLEEIQDNTGAEITDSITSASETLQTLIDAIAAVDSNLNYGFIDNTFISDDTSGGQPGGNIRTAFLYNLDRVNLVEGSVRTITDPQNQQTNSNNPFFNSRLPLAATFTFNGEDVTVINNHFSSKGGSSPLFGRIQPTAGEFQEAPNINGSLDDRREQAQAVNDFVETILADTPKANVVVQGDLNEFEFISPLDNILTENLTNLTETLPENERYSFIFDGNSQSLDHVLVSDNLVSIATFDEVHVNSEFSNSEFGGDRASDHDPLLSRFTFAPPAPPTLSIDDVTVTEGDSGTTNATFTVTLSKSSAETVTVKYATADNGSATAGSDYVDEENGTLTFTSGEPLTQTISVAVKGDTTDEADETFLVNLSSATSATIADAEGIGTITDNDVSNIQTGTDDPETFATTTSTDVIDASGGNDKINARVASLQQSDRINGGADMDTFVLSVGTNTDSIRINANNPSDQLQGIIGFGTLQNFESFDLTNFEGSTSFTGTTLADRFLGGVGNDTVTGSAGNDFFKGGSGDDDIDGGAGNDTISGGAGNDILAGGTGNDSYSVNSTSDQIIEAANAGTDSVRSSASFTLDEYVEDLTLVGNSKINATGNTLNNTLIGNGANNTLNGSAGADTVLGSAGNDQLIGGSGADILTGGTGADSFVFNFPTEGIDMITDFSVAVGGETINVSKAGFSPGLSSNMINQSINAQQFRIRTGSRAVDSSDRFIYNKNTGGLFFDQDGIGGVREVQLAQLSAGLAMTNNDIFVIA